jgi:hypothetical protein
MKSTVNWRRRLTDRRHIGRDRTSRSAAQPARAARSAVPYRVEGHRRASLSAMGVGPAFPRRPGPRQYIGLLDLGHVGTEGSVIVFSRRVIHRETSAGQLGAIARQAQRNALPTSAQTEPPHPRDASSARLCFAPRERRDRPHNDRELAPIASLRRPRSRKCLLHPGEKSTCLGQITP